MSDTDLLTLDEAKTRYQGPLVKIVLEWLTIMDRIVNRDKGTPATPDDWRPLGELVDRERFRRVGNFGVRNDWPSYTELLAAWAAHSWWKGSIGRTREVPGADGQPSLVYMETEERSSAKGPVVEGGEYNVLASIAVYEIDAEGKVARLHVYDQHA